MKNDKNVKKIILLLQIILTLFGTALAIMLLFMSFKKPSLLGILGSVTYLITHLAIIVYTAKNYNKKRKYLFSRRNLCLCFSAWYSNFTSRKLYI